MKGFVNTTSVPARLLLRELPVREALRNGRIGPDEECDGKSRPIPLIGDILKCCFCNCVMFCA